MGLKIYMPLAVLCFLAATTGADVLARTSIAGEPLDLAMREHLYWAARQFVGTALLFAPFLAVAFLSARAEKQVRTRSVAAVFAAAMIILLYFYFEGHRAKETAMLAELWTAAALSVGLLPFFPGAPTALGAWGAFVMLERLDARRPD